MQVFILAFLMMFVGSEVACQASSQSSVVQQVAHFQPTVGWDPDYDKVIAIETLKAKVVLKVPQTRMVNMCPRWYLLSPQEKMQMWADLVYSIAYAESGHDRSVMYNEVGISHWGQQDIDSVTGKPIVSEGLMQLSYADMKSYPTAGCAFDWNADKDKFVDDWNQFAATGKRTVHSKHLDRTIIDGPTNLRCAIQIMDIIMSSSTISDHYNDLRDALGRYWSTMRPGDSAFKNTTWPMFKKRNKACFQ